MTSTGGTTRSVSSVLIWTSMIGRTLQPKPVSSVMVTSGRRRKLPPVFMISSSTILPSTTTTETSPFSSPVSLSMIRQWGWCIGNQCSHEESGEFDVVTGVVTTNTGRVIVDDGNGGSTFLVVTSTVRQNGNQLTGLGVDHRGGDTVVVGDVDRGICLR